MHGHTTIKETISDIPRTVIVYVFIYANKRT